MSAVQTLLLLSVLHQLPVCRCAGDVYSSVHQIKQALTNLDTYLDAIDGFIEKEEDRLRNIKR